MTKARDLADLISTGNPLADGAIAASEVSGLATVATSGAVADVSGAAPLASPTFTGTATAPTINASTALQIGGVAVTATAAELNIMDGVTATAAELNILDGVTATASELNIMDGVTVSASDINTVTAKAPSASPTFTGDVTLPDKIVHTGDTNTAIRFPANDTVSFETAGSERFRFGSSGELGIGGATYGTSGQVLTSGGSGAAPTWADAASGGTAFSAF